MKNHSSTAFDVLRFSRCRRRRSQEFETGKARMMMCFEAGGLVRALRTHVIRAFYMCPLRC